MARPKKSEKQSARSAMGFRPKDEAEEHAILRKIEASGLTKSEYLRRMALSGRVSVRRSESKAKTPPFELINELRRIGVNLNQAVRKLNATDQMPVGLPALLETVEAAVMKAIDNELRFDGSKDCRERAEL